MLLAIDVGNTNTVFAIIEGSTTLESWRCSTYNARTSDEYYVWLEPLIGLKASIRDIETVIISSVVPGVLFNLEQLCQKYFDTEPIIVGTGNCRLPVEVRIDPGVHVGSDRLVNTVSAFDQFGGDLIVVDFGTATTFDVVDNDGAYIGGVISPGIDLSLRALHEAAAALPHVGVEIPPSIIGKNTLDCMHSGIFWGYVSLIEGICRRIQEEQGRDLKIIGTGGYSTVLAQADHLFDKLDADLTIHGLAVIYNYNVIGTNDQV
ncbi:MAG: type III pantothenate kinase [Paracoccaceae bacterium]|nr:type III pantothenate kinase [Paracoccaceae bacterium]MDE2673869.1 type III pantothenate kinase [Paracoccaceae bacterium]MXZ50220.1 type III pantothenate kinase [Paracoccaceae bacterium]MYF46799.1 type III pantothenate kinase [Paracoccaceae bacterium]MYG11156.1 type III pantothenate kinase [Paracoccaceae bacterium]